MSLPARSNAVYRNCGVDGASQPALNMDMAVTLKRRRFTVDEYHRMAEVRILAPGERVELIDGQILEMTPIGARHIRCVIFLTEAFVRRLDGRALVSSQNALRLNQWSEPEPDLVLLRPPLARYGKDIPTPAHALLVVEVADSSHHRDRAIKLPRYAAAGVPEAWIVDLDGEGVEGCRDLVGGRYHERRRVPRGGNGAPGALPDVTLRGPDHPGLGERRQGRARQTASGHHQTAPPAGRG